MSLSQKDILEVFKQNFLYEVVGTPFGEAVKMPAYDAFIFSNVTGAGYLNDPLYPFSPNGLLKVLNKALNHSFVNGLFENFAPKNTPWMLSQTKSFLFDTPHKFIVPIEYTSKQTLTDRLEHISTEVTAPTDYLIFGIDTSKRGNGMEPFLEYLACQHYSKAGYIVETQVPIAHDVGSPDFAGYRIPGLAQSLPAHLQKGCHLIELAMLRVSLDRHVAHACVRGATHMIVGEAKCFPGQATGQLDKYTATGFYDEGLEIYPARGTAQTSYGVLNLAEDYSLQFAAPTKPLTVDADKQQAYAGWLGDYMKFYLLANLDGREFNELAQQVIGAPVADAGSMIRFIQIVSVETLVEKSRHGSVQ